MSKLDWAKDYDELLQYPVSELETMAIEINEKRTMRRWNGIDDFGMFLEARQRKLNKEFVFTPEHIEKFLWLDQEIKKYANILREKGEKMVEELERMIKDEKSFFNDYEIECVISPQISIWKDDEIKEEDKILDVIESFHFEKREWALKFDPSSLDCSCYFDEFNTIDNWNTTIHKWRELIEKNPELANHHIGYGMHELYDHSLWALQDIMQISDFHCDIKVEYQKY